MSKSSRKNRFKLKIINKSALLRLVVFITIILVLSIWGYWIMFWMPKQSYQGQLPPLEPEEIILQKSLKVVAMLSLETMGYFSDQPGSQEYPYPINLIYPNQGNFISFIGNLKSSNLVKKSIASFRNHVKFPSQGTALPSFIPAWCWLVRSMVFLAARISRDNGDRYSTLSL